MTNNEIRAWVLEHLRAQGITQAELARGLGVTHQAVSSVLTGKSGRIPASLEKVLDAAGLELVVRVKGNRSD